MSDKKGPTREHEQFPAQPQSTAETERNLEKQKPQNTAEEMRKLGESINLPNQIPKRNQEVINKMLKECEKGKYRTPEQLTGYQPFVSGKFKNPSDVHLGHISYLYANNLLTEGREVIIGKYEDGYAMYHKV